MNQSQVYICSLPLEPPSQPPPHPTPLGCYRAPVLVPCVIQQIPTGYLFCFNFLLAKKKGGNKDNFTIYQVYNIQTGQFLRSRTIFTIETRQNPNSGCNEQNHPQQPAGDMMENVIRLQLLHYRLRPAQHSSGPGGLQPLFPAACWFLLP